MQPLTTESNFWIRNSNTFENIKRVAAIIVTAIFAIALLGSILLFLANQGYNLGGINSLALSFGTQGIYLAMIASGAFLVCSAVMTGIILRHSFQKPSSTKKLQKRESIEKENSAKQTPDEFSKKHRLDLILTNIGDYWIEKNLKIGSGYKDVVFYRNAENKLVHEVCNLDSGEEKVQGDIGVFNRNAKEEFEKSKEYPQELGLSLILGAEYPYDTVKNQITNKTYWPEVDFKTKSEAYPKVSFVMVQYPLKSDTVYFKKSDDHNTYLKTLDSNYELASVKKPSSD